MSILASQNINNLGADFGAAPYNPFPKESQQPESTPNVGWSGYKYAGPGLQAASDPTEQDDRTVATGESMMNNSGDNPYKYGPEGRRMANDQHSILGSLAKGIAGASTMKGDAWGKLQYTIATSMGAKSLRTPAENDAGGNAMSSGTPVPQNTANYPYTMIPNTVFVAGNPDVEGDAGTLNGIPLADGFGQPESPASAIKDYNKDGVVDFADFFMLGDHFQNAESLTVPAAISQSGNVGIGGIANLPGIRNFEAYHTTNIASVEDKMYDEGRA